jgi:DNA-binding response OmpR family regulator
MEQTRVLLVDDEQDIVDTIKYSLELRGFEVDTAFDGVSAINMARSDTYDILILDVMLPGKNG